MTPCDAAGDVFASEVPVQEGAVVPDEASGPRLLVLTDVGEAGLFGSE